MAFFLLNSDWHTQPGPDRSQGWGGVQGRCQRKSLKQWGLITARHGAERETGLGKYFHTQTQRFSFWSWDVTRASLVWSFETTAECYPCGFSQYSQWPVSSDSSWGQVDPDEAGREARVPHHLSRKPELHLKVPTLRGLTKSLHWRFYIIVAHLPQSYIKINLFYTYT